MRIKTPRKYISHTTFMLCFTYINPPTDLKGAGCGVDCDAHGKVNEELLKSRPLAYENYLSHKSGKVWRLTGVQYAWVRDDTHPDGGNYQPVYCTGRWVELEVVSAVRDYTNSHTEPAVGECNNCGHDVVLYGFTNTCNHCGTDYNQSGQELAPRSQWGEETGESLSDILAIDHTDTLFEEG